MEGRLWPKVDKSDPSGCWVWRAGLRNGYGEFRPDPKSKAPAHRVVWELLVGPIPDGMELDHRRCRNKRCVNPDHLELTTKPGNLLEPDGAAGINKAKTHCPQGHPYSGDNLIVYQSGPRKGARLCRACQNAWYRRSVESGHHAMRVRRWKAANA
jgi:hypothetical protein